MTGEQLRHFRKWVAASSKVHPAVQCRYEIAVEGDLFTPTLQ